MIFQHHSLNNETKNDGRKGWVEWQTEKETCIKPRDYGEFISKKRRKKK